jgi:Leucine-rich repeat (LRR) protein
VDLSPLEKMQTLEKLLLNLTPVSDLSPLKGLRLRHVDVTGCPIRDISPLRSSALEELILRETRVTDISPLARMPLKLLDLAAVPVIDFTPLAGLPLEICNFDGCQLTDLSVVRGMPLRELLLWNCPVTRNYAVLGEIKTLELLKLPETYNLLPENELAAIESLRSHPKLGQIGSEMILDHTTTRSKEVFWRDWDRIQPLFSALRRSGFEYRIANLPNGTFSVGIESQPLSDLSFLKGTPISELWLNECKVTDLAPIQDLPIRVLGLHGNPVADLRPLGKMPLEELSIEWTKVSDLSSLTGLRLKKLYLHGCEYLTDVSALAEIPTLEKLTVPTSAQNIEKLRNLPKLKLLAFGTSSKSPYLPVFTTAQFWEEYEHLGWIRAIRDAGLTPKRLNRMSDGTWELDLSQSAIIDLSILRGAPISILWLFETDVSDLKPLRGMGLKKLHLYNTRVIDLSPLKGMPLESLNLVSTKVTDLSALRRMPLTSLSLNNCTELTDLSPLAEVKTLTNVTLPLSAKNFEFLRDFLKLERLSYAEDPNNSHRPDKTAAEFWMDYDTKKK